MKKFMTTVAAISMMAAPAFAADIDTKLADAATKIYGAINAFDSDYSSTGGTGVLAVDHSLAGLAYEIDNYNSYVTIQLSDGVDGGYSFNPACLCLEYNEGTDATFGNIINTEINADSISDKVDLVVSSTRTAILGNAKGLANGSLQAYANEAANGSAGAMLQAVATAVYNVEEGVAHFNAGTTDDNGIPLVDFAELIERADILKVKTDEFKVASDTANAALDAASDSYAFNGLIWGEGQTPNAGWGFKAPEHKEFDVDGSYNIEDYDFSSYK